MSITPIPLRRITLYKNDLGYFERTTNISTSPAVIQVAKKHKKLVIDTLCTTASTVTFDTEEYDKYVAANTKEDFFSFGDLSSNISFIDFLQSCIGAEIVLSLKGNSQEEVGKLVVINEEKALLGPNASETTSHYSLKILNKDGFIRNFDRQYNR